MRRIVLFAPLLVGSLVLAACGVEPTPTSTPPAATPSPTGGQATATPTPTPPAPPGGGTATPTPDQEDVTPAPGGRADGPASLTVTEHDGVTHLANEGGRSLYVYTVDEEGQSHCFAPACADHFPPLLTEGAPQAGEGVDGSLLGTVQREDGTTQVTYNGRPLYLYVEDTGACDTEGHGIAGQFFLLSLEGDPLEVAPDGSIVAPTPTPAG